MAQDAGYSRYVTGVKSDTVDQDGFTDITKAPQSCFDAVFVGTGGVIAIVDSSGVAQNFTVATGGLLPVKGRRINSTNTAAALMVCLYR